MNTNSKPTDCPNSDASGVGGVGRLREGWRPIETAPRDGRSVLWGAPGYVPQQGHWANGVIFSAEHDGYDYVAPLWQPTHWHAIPAPPEATP